MHQIKYGTILLVTATLIGCATSYIPVESNTHNDVLQPSPIHFTDFDWRVQDGMQCLTQKDYQNLSESMSEVKRYIMQNSIIISEHNKLYGEVKND